MRCDGPSVPRSAPRLARRRLVVVPFIAAAVGLTACAATATGSPSAAQPASDASSGATAEDLTALKPCDLPDPALMSQLQLKQEGTSNSGGVRGCDYKRLPDIDGMNGYSVDVGIRDKQGLKDVITTGYTPSPDNIGHHQGTQLRGSTECFAVIGVGSSTRVDVLVVTDDPDQACQVANQIAATVEPKLPGGGN